MANKSRYLAPPLPMSAIILQSSFAILWFWLRVPTSANPLSLISRFLSIRRFPLFELIFFSEQFRKPFSKGLRAYLRKRKWPKGPAHEVFRQWEKLFSTENHIYLFEYIKSFQTQIRKIWATVSSRIPYFAKRPLAGLHYWSKRIGSLCLSLKKKQILTRKFWILTNIASFQEVPVLFKVNSSKKCKILAKIIKLRIISQFIYKTEKLVFDCK